MPSISFKFFALLILSVLFISGPSMAEESLPDGATEGKRPLTEEEIGSTIGRFGEVEEVPEDFQFSRAENVLWLESHLDNIEKPSRLYYAFNRSGSYEDGFSDSVFLDIIKINDDGSKNASLDFFTAARKQNIGQENVTAIRGNPVIGVYMQGDVYEMNRLTEGSWRYFQKRIKIALRESAQVENVEFDFNGKRCRGEKVVFMPYLDDPHRPDFEKFATKRYEIIMSDDVPGMLYQIHTIVPAAGQDAGKQPLLEETLTLMEAKFAAN